MNVDKITRDIRKQVGELHRRRHPSKGVVVEFAGFQEDVDYRADLMRRLTRHKNDMPDLIRRRVRILQNTRRWYHIRQNIVKNRAPLIALSVHWHNGNPIGFEITDHLGRVEVTLASDPQAYDNLQDLRDRAAKGYVVFHDIRLMNENFDIMGQELPDFHATIDTAQVAGLMMPFRSQRSPGSVEVGRMVGIDKAQYESQGEFLIATAMAMSVRDNLFTK